MLLGINRKVTCVITHTYYGDEYDSIVIVDSIIIIIYIIIIIIVVVVIVLVVVTATEERNQRLQVGKAL